MSHNQTFNFSESGDILEHCDGMVAGVVAWAVSSALFSLLGCPACIAVLWEHFRRHRTGAPVTPNDVFMLNLTIMDLVFLFFIPLGLCSFFLLHIKPLQVFFDFLYALNLAGRPLLTASICVDCYLAVVHPVTYHRNKSLTPRVLIAAGVWTVTLAQGTASVLIDEFQHSPLAMIVYIIALPVIIICDISILWALKRSHCRQGRLHPKKKKALQIITNSLVMTFTSYFPPVLGYILGGLIITDAREYDCLLAIPILITPTAGSAIMPILYLGNLRGLRSFCFLK